MCVHYSDLSGVWKYLISPCLGSLINWGQQVLIPYTQPILKILLSKQTASDACSTFNIFAFYQTTTSNISVRLKEAIQFEHVHAHLCMHVHVLHAFKALLHPR